MQDNESFTNHVNKSQVAQERTAESSLITLDRSQKLDLLIHLISNLRQALVICGPKGIGKTTLLDELKVRKQEKWPIYAIDVSSNLSFESFQDQLLKFLKQSYGEFKNQDIFSILSGLDKQNQKIVVIIDDCGQLVPGLIDTLIQYASPYSCLRMVFSLTHDELHIKNSSDRTIDECHFIDLPPLTEKQCGVFLQNLSAKPGAIVSFDAINERLIEKLYQKTHGIPGRIISELPALSNYNAVSEYKWGGALLLSALLALGIGYMTYDEADTEPYQNEIKTPVLLPKSEVVEISSPVIHMVDKDEIIKEPVGGHPEDVETDVFSFPLVSNSKKVDSNDSVFENIEQTGIKSNIRSMKKVNDQVTFQGTNLENDADEKIRKNKFSVVGTRFVSDKIKKTINTVPQLINTEKKKSKKIDNNEKPSEKKIRAKIDVDVIAKTIVNPVLEQQRIKTEKKKLGKVENKEKSNEKTIKTELDVITESVVSIPVKLKATRSGIKKSEKVENKEEAKNKRIKTKLDVFVVNDNSQWIMKQPITNYTIQLMVLSKHKSVIDLLKKSKSLKENLKYFQVSKKNRKQYVIIYGSYKSIAAASQQMKQLPVQYRKSWIRSYKILKKEIIK